jgi:hypothetical protein
VTVQIGFITITIQMSGSQFKKMWQCCSACINWQGASGENILSITQTSHFVDTDSTALRDLKLTQTLCMSSSHCQYKVPEDMLVDG